MLAKFWCGPKSNPLALMKLKALRPNSFPRFLTTLLQPSILPPKCSSALILPSSLPNQTHLDYEHSIVSILKSCSASSSISSGQQVHSLVLKVGYLNSNTFIRNSLINMYLKCGRISDAQLLFYACSSLDYVSCNIMITGFVNFGQLDNAIRLFDKMLKRNCIAYTTVIMGLVKDGFFLEAAYLFKEMMAEGISPNEFTVVSVILSYADFQGNDWSGGLLHGLAMRLGVVSHIVVSTNLVKLYCVCSLVEDARVLFEEMSEPNIVSWNVMLNGYSKAGKVDSARALFEMIPAKDVISWGTMIDGYVKVGRLREALEVYCQMQHTGLGPNDVMIVDLMSACGQLDSMIEGLQIHSTIVKMGYDCYDYVQATLIQFYATCRRIDLACLQFESASKDHLPSWNVLMGGFVKNGMVDQARQVFNEMPERDVFSWSTMISGYAQSEQPTMALEVFHYMIEDGIKPNEVTMVSVLSAIASLGKVEDAKWVHAYIHNNSIHLNDNLRAAVIDMYAKCGSVDTALEIFYQCRDKVASICPWNAIICGLAMHGQANVSLEIFSDLQRLPIKPSSITFVGVLTACCHAGLVEAGEEYFKTMKGVYRIEPNIKHYGCMVDLLGRAGRLEEAEELINSMPIEADVVIWGALLGGCRKHENVNIGERAAESLKRLDMSHVPGRVLLSNLYCDAGRWEDARAERKEIHRQRFKKLPGYSFV